MGRTRLDNIGKKYTKGVDIDRIGRDDIATVKKIRKCVICGTTLSKYNICDPIKLRTRKYYLCLAHMKLRLKLEDKIYSPALRETILQAYKRLYGGKK